MGPMNEVELLVAAVRRDQLLVSTEKKSCWKAVPVPTCMTTKFNCTIYTVQSIIKDATKNVVFLSKTMV